MNFQDPRCSLVEPRYLEFIPTGCHSSVSDCNTKSSLRVVFKIGLPSLINKSTLLIEIINLVTSKKQNYFISIPDGKCNCEPECFVAQIVKEDFLYITVIFNNLIEGDNHLLQACIDYILATPTPTITPTVSITPTITPTISITPSITPTISVTPTITPTVSVTPTVTPTISVTPTITPSTSPPVSQPYANYSGVANWNGTIAGNFTTIGSNGPASYYGTYDQHGNASEIVSTGTAFRSIGGDYASTTLNKTSTAISSNYGEVRIGCRLASTISRDNFAYIEDINNSPDGNGFGSVDHNFYISKGLLTVGQYAKFLNSVFKSAASVSVLTGLQLGITRYGTGTTSSIPYVWVVDPNMFNKPLAGATVLDICKYCNWFLAGQPINSFSSTNYYTIGDAYTINQSDGDGTTTKNTLAQLYISEINEWYKAAFYDASLFGNAGGYWDYATRSDTTPTPATSDSDGDGPFNSSLTSVPEPLIENAANFGSIASWGGSTGNATTVGTNGVASEYGCYDMNGNVWEWTDVRSANNFIIMGGGWATSLSTDFSRDASANQSATYSVHTFGFRIGTRQSTPTYNYDFMSIGDTSENVSYGGLGVVNYEYSLSKYQITNNQYVEFLNATASISDTYGLFGDTLQSSPRSGISRTGSIGSYVYTSKAYYANKPVIDISCIRAMRFCNWLHNGKPSGEQNNSTTETGAYTISDIIGANPPSVSRNVGALYFLPSENEWFKAAFYKRLGNGTYHVYATKSDSIPRKVFAIDTLNVFRGNGLSS